MHNFPILEKIRLILGIKPGQNEGSPLSCIALYLRNAIILSVWMKTILKYLRVLILRNHSQINPKMATVAEKESYNDNRNYLKNLIFLAFSDGEMDELEKALIYRIGLKRGFSEDQVDGLLSHVTTSQQLPVPKTISEKADLLFDFMQILYADGHVNNQEIEFMRCVISRFNLDAAIMGKLIELFRYATPSQEEWLLFVDNISGIKERQQTVGA